MDGDSKPRPAVEKGSTGAEEEPTDATPSPAHTTRPGGAQETVVVATGEPPRVTVDNDDDVVLVEEATLPATPTDCTEPGPAPTAAMETTTTAPGAPAEPIVIDDEEDPEHRDSASEAPPGGALDSTASAGLSSTEPDSDIKIASVTTLGPAPAQGTDSTPTPAPPSPEPEGDMNLMITSVTSLQGASGGGDAEGAESGLQISSSFSLSPESSASRAAPTFNPGRVGAASLVQNGETGTHQRPGNAHTLPTPGAPSPSNMLDSASVLSDSWISQSASFPRNQKQPGVETPPAAAPLAKPPGPPPSGSQPRTVKVTCANCKKPLRKGQTAYQRKGSTHLFCSTTCLSAFSHKPAPKKSCTMCKKDITTMKGTIVAQVDSSESFQEFCSTGCLGAYENKQNPPKSSIKTKCTVCGKLTEIRHEVSFKNVTHKICSDACFNRYRMTNGLIMNCCEQCGDYLPSRACASHFLLVDGQNKRFCCQNCVRDFKQAHGKMGSCSSCKTLIKTGEVTHSIGPSGSMETYCSSTCMNKSKMATVTTTILSSEPTCHFCKRTSLPQYQATLPEGNILNFCSSTCVTKFQNATIQTATNGQAQLSTNNSIQLKCNYCRGAFSLQPETLEWEDKVYQFCSKACCEDYKKLHCIVTFCHHCQEEKTLHETVQFSGVKRPFCSEGCKLLFKQDFAKRLGLKCVSCNHCNQLCKRGVTRQLGGVTRDFCSETCAKKFHDWYHKAARCDCCKVQGSLTESVQWRAEMKHFCDQHCLLRFYCQQNQPNLVTQKGPENTSLEIGLQTHGTKLAVLGQGAGTYAGGGGVKDVKNKAVLCKPLTLTKATYCKPHMQSKHLQTDVDDGVKREYIPVPIPVPVFIPVPMNLYTQVTPAALALPVPVPVPVFLPTTLQGAEQIVQAISELKTRVPPDPMEADLLTRVPPDPMEADLLTRVPQDPMEADLLAMAQVIAEDQKPDVKRMKVKKERGEGGERSSSSSSSSWDDEEEDEEEDKYEPELDLEKDFPEVLSQTPGPEEDMEMGLTLLPVLEEEAPRPRRLGQKRRAVEGEPLVAPPALPSLALRPRYGVNAWRRWALSSLHQSADTNGKESPKLERPARRRSSLLSLSPPELSHALARFVWEVRRPNGDRYAPDSVLYLCLGIQQHLQAKGRKDDLFSDPSYREFGEELNKVIRDWQPSVLPDGSLWGRVEEQGLWDCRVLGEESPWALLRSLVYLNTKNLGLHTVDQHLHLSFNSVYGPDRTHPLTHIHRPTLPQEHRLPPGSGKRKREEEEDGDPELPPDDGSGSATCCPVQKQECWLYELYCSKCPESLRQRTDVFYATPEEAVGPDSPLWFSSAPLDRGVLELLLPRFLLVRDVYRGTRHPDEKEKEEEEEREEQGEGEGRL